MPANEETAMTLIQRVTRDGTAARGQPPRPGKGDRRAIPSTPPGTSKTRDGLYCGLWQSTPGKWRVSYSEWEYFHILSGISILTGDGWQRHPAARGRQL